MDDRVKTGDGRRGPPKTRGMSQEEYRLRVQDHLVTKIDLEAAESQVRWPADLEDEPSPPDGWADLSEDWPAFRSAMRAGDELWTYDTVWVNGGFACGEKGFALLRQGRVFKWYITEVLC